MSILTVSQREAFATKLNKEINIPLVRERREQVIFRKIVDSADKHMGKYIPDEYLEAITSRNISVEELVTDALQENLTPLLASLIPLPMFPRSLKEQIIDLIIKWIVDAMISDELSIQDVLDNI